MSGTETFYNEVDTAFSGQPGDFGGEGPLDGFSDATGMGTTSQSGSNPAY